MSCPALPTIFKTLLATSPICHVRNFEVKKLLLPQSRTPDVDKLFKFRLIGHYRNVRGLGKSMVVFRLFEKLRYSNERLTIF